MSDSARFTVGVCAYNEGRNIERCIRSIFEQELDGYELCEVIVVSSASTDSTDDIVRSLTSEYDCLRLVPQEKREGKNSAINRLLEEKSTDIVVLVNADNVLASKDTLRKMVEPFSDPKVGMVGGHPLVINERNRLPDYASRLIWALHHHIALKSPKIGELIAFIDVGIKLPVHNQSDEDFIRSGVEGAGLTVVYAPEAVTYIRGPETFSDLVKQRFRVNVGQSYMVNENNFYNPARDPRVLFDVFSDTMKDLGFHPIKLIISVMMECGCRITASMYAKKDRGDLSAWDPVSSTKKV